MPRPSEIFVIAVIVFGVFMFARLPHIGNWLGRKVKGEVSSEDDT